MKHRTLSVWIGFAAVLVLVVAVDVVVIGFIVDSLLLLLLGILVIAAMLVFSGFMVFRSYRQRLPNGPIWEIGDGVELSNPEKPKKVHVVLPQKTLDLGFLGVGSPGSGKTVSLGVGYLQYLKQTFDDRAFAVIDGKGDIDFYLSLLKAGIQPDHFLSSELPGSDSINLFAGEPNDVVDRCLRFLLPTTTTTTFYADEQRTTLNSLVSVMKQLNTPSNLRDLYTVLTVEEAAVEFLSLAKRAEGLSETDLTMARQWFDVPFEDRFRLNKGLMNRLSVFCAGAQNDRFNAYQPDIDIHRCMSEGRSVFFHLPYSEFSKDIAVALVETFGVEARKRQLSGPEQFQFYPLLFEDYGGFFHDNFGPISSRCRSARMPLNFTFQSLAQLQKVAEAFKDELDDNLPTKVVFRVMGMNTSNFAVRLLGDFQTRELSSSDYGDRENVSMQNVRENRIEPRQLRELAPGEAFVSTILYKNGGVENPLYRVQFPAASLDESVNASLPAAKITEEGEGLKLWSKYMSPTRLRDIQEKVQQEILDKAEVVA